MEETSFIDNPIYVPRRESFASDVDYPSPKNITVGLAKFWKYLSWRDLIIFVVVTLMVAAFITWILV